MHRGLFPLLDRATSVWFRKQQQSEYNWWGWHQSSTASEGQFRTEKLAEAEKGDDEESEKESENEADLSGWDQCGVVYGNGLYDDDDGEDSITHI